MSYLISLNTLQRTLRWFVNKLSWIWGPIDLKDIPCPISHGIAMSYLKSLNPKHFKNIAYVRSFENVVFLYVHICVFLQFRFETRECNIYRNSETAMLPSHIWYPESHAFEKYIFSEYILRQQYSKSDKSEKVACCCCWVYSRPG